MQERIANFWAQGQGKVRPLYAVIKEHGLNGLRKVIQEQAPVLWAKAQEKAEAAWQQVTAKVKGVPGFQDRR